MKKLFTIFIVLVCIAGAFAQSEKPVVVIVPFDSKGVDQSEVDVLFEVFQSEFANTGKAKVVDRGSFDKIKKQQQFQLSDWSNTDKVAELGKALNANCVITGQVMSFGGQIVSSIKMIDVNTTEILSATTRKSKDTMELFNYLPTEAKELSSKIVVKVEEHPDKYCGIWESIDGYSFTFNGTEYKTILKFELKKDGSAVVYKGVGEMRTTKGYCISVFESNKGQGTWKIDEAGLQVSLYLEGKKTTHCSKYISKDNIKYGNNKLPDGRIITVPGNYVWFETKTDNYSPKFESQNIDGSRYCKWKISSEGNFIEIDSNYSNIANTSIDSSGFRKFKKVSN